MAKNSLGKFGEPWEEFTDANGTRKQVHYFPCFDYLVQKYSLRTKTAHPNLVKCHGFVQKGSNYGITFELIYENIRFFSLEESLRQKCFGQIFEALLHLNKQGLLHGSIDENHIAFKGNSFLLRDFLIQEKLEEFHRF